MKTVEEIKEEIRVLENIKQENNSLNAINILNGYIVALEWVLEDSENVEND